MKNVHDFPDLIPDDLMARVRKLDPDLLCDGMKDLGIPSDGCMDAGIRPVNPDPSVVMAGTAVTVSTENGDMLPVRAATCITPPRRLCDGHRRERI